jgi:hypothetical protein
LGQLVAVNTATNCIVIVRWIRGPGDETLKVTSGEIKEFLGLPDDSGTA